MTLYLKIVLEVNRTKMKNDSLMTVCGQNSTRNSWINILNNVRYINKSLICYFDHVIILHQITSI